MSLILEALRKSEAERQIGRAPGLLTPMPMAARPGRGRPLAWLAVVVVLLVAVAALAWWMGRSGAALPASAPDATALPAPSEATPPAIAPPPDAAPAARTAAAPIAAPPAARPAPPALPAAGPGDLPADPDFPSRERESLPLPPPAAPATAAPAPAPAPSEPVVDQAPAELAFVTPLRALSDAEREGLPPLRMSMHVYAEAADARFVLIDGRRRAEGDPLGQNVRLLEIRRDGAVIDLGGRRLLIERP